MNENTKNPTQNYNLKNKKFNYRAFTSIFMTISFLMLWLTGCVLFITPPGRIANWTGWTIMGLTKNQWSDVHIWFGTVFILTSVFHLIFNWRILINYLKNRTNKKISFKPEWILAVIISAVIMISTIADIPPFSKLMDLNSAIKYSWDKKEQAAPIAHAELLTFAELAQKINYIDLKQIKTNLMAKGIELKSSSITIGELAESHNMTAAKLYNIATTGSNQGQKRNKLRNNTKDASNNNTQENHVKGKGGYGIGRMTLKTFCAANSINLKNAVKKLRQKAPDTSINADTPMRSIADALNIHPSQMRDILL